MATMSVCIFQQGQWLEVKPRSDKVAFSVLIQSEYSQILVSSVAMVLIMMMVVVISIVEIKGSSFRIYFDVWPNL